MITVALVAAFLVALSVTFPLVDTDFWQHLLVGKAIWTTHSIPRVNLWTWPTFGEPQVLPSWGFRALVWPFEALGGVTGLFVWRWLTTVAAFALLWATARTLGARGFTPLVVLVLCAQIYRTRAQVRPETLVAVLLALELWMLELRRARRVVAPPERAGAETSARPRPWGDPGLWLVVVAWIWANVHISYYVGLLVIGIHLLDERLAARRRAAPAAGLAPLGLVLLASIAASFLNPFGWRALAQPFEYFFVWRHELIFRTIGELGPIGWSENLTNGLPVVVLGWPLLALWRARRFGADWAEAGTAVLFIGLALSSKRFLGPLALAAAPYLARDLGGWVRSRRWPSWSAPVWNRAALALAASAALVPPGWQYADLRPGIGIAPEFPPQAACDFIAAHGIRGRAFNQFEFGGYLLWRFWPDRSRLPFMDIHQTGTKEDRFDYIGALVDEKVWRAFDAGHRFEWALLKRVHPPDDHSLDFLDDDPSWSLVFADDAAALYVKRGGALAAVVDSFGYRLVPGGTAHRDQLAVACLDDDAIRARAERELRRMAAESPHSAQALSLLASMLILDAAWVEARDALERAHRIDPRLPVYRQRLQTIEDSLAARGR